MYTNMANDAQIRCSAHGFDQPKTKFVFGRFTLKVTPEQIILY